jgi:hypothetical protein
MNIMPHSRTPKMKATDLPVKHQDLVAKLQRKSEWITLLTVTANEKLKPIYWNYKKVKVSRNRPRWPTGFPVG